jgi:hypothetical protein
MGCRCAHAGNASYWYAVSAIDASICQVIRQHHPPWVEIWVALHGCTWTWVSCQQMLQNLIPCSLSSDGGSRGCRLWKGLLLANIVEPSLSAHNPVILAEYSFQAEEPFVWIFYILSQMVTQFAERGNVQSVWGAYLYILTQQEAFNCVMKVWVWQVMGTVSCSGQIPSLDFVLPLCPSFHCSQLHLNCCFNCLYNRKNPDFSA